MQYKTLILFIFFLIILNELTFCQSNCEYDSIKKVYIKKNSICNCIEKNISDNYYSEITFEKGVMIYRKDYYLNGQLKLIVNYKDNSVDGQVKYYYSNGQLETINEFKDKRRIGNWYNWYNNGQLQANRTYINDSLNGISSFWDKLGTKISESYFINEKIDSIDKQWYSNGQLNSEIEYDKGRIMNIKGLYREDGRSLDYGTLKDGNGNVISYSQSDEKYIVDCITEYKNGIENGNKIRFYNYPSDTLSITEYIKGKENGRYIEFYNLNKKKIIGQYINTLENNSEKDGTWKYYFEDGSIVREEIFEKGNLLKTNYYGDNGKLIELPNPSR